MHTPLVPVYEMELLAQYQQLSSNPRTNVDVFTHRLALLYLCLLVMVVVCLVMWSGQKVVAFFFPQLSTVWQLVVFLDMLTVAGILAQVSVRCFCELAQRVWQC